MLNVKIGDEMIVNRNYTTCRITVVSIGKTTFTDNKGERWLLRNGARHGDGPYHKAYASEICEDSLLGERRLLVKMERQKIRTKLNDLAIAVTSAARVVDGEVSAVARWLAACPIKEIE